MAPKYKVELSPEAQSDLRAIPAFHRPRVVKALAALEHEAEVETRRRKALAEPIEALPGASWEVRVGDYRGLYQIAPVDGGAPREVKTARVLRVILKGTSTTQEAVSRARKP
jgi:mRNA-degrading endonuclease RelE of RelBE toxin-antitoxin system